MRSRAVRFHWSLFAAALLCLCLSAPAFAGEHGKAPEAKRGILLVAFGTSVPEAAASIDELTRQAKAAFPGVPVRLAYSSKIIRDKIAGEGVQKRSPAQALADMAAEGFTEVAVQSLHSIPGREFTDISATAKAFEGMPKSMGTISVGRPLLSTPEDIALAAQAVLKSLPKRGRGEAVVLMGHGTEHPANAAYSALQLELWKKDPGVFVATVESSPSLEDIIPALKRMGARTVHLLPLMSVAGDHAHNDMAGSEEDSWVSILKAKGFAPKAELTGLGSRPAVARLWIEHLKDAVKELDH
ncbi:sirohydrochlorin cobaltochelatase [Humidesulfovibrio mexicanus]|uniref:Sirohydrochlorin cobaltochelatase n=1 Tax=Humidesulfovibrio mexicanus TaxID=147047 RepID=A0A239BFK5_9BACT|nr:sirohydrochlorin cobaltochelatase [Humidesulfovibrio mexicanus]SNS06825.1 sirohydrochlorin cobaltochelatase [Humidesulfovibrio mexicanus]